MGPKLTESISIYYACTVSVVYSKDFYIRLQEKFIIFYQLFLELIRLFRNIPQFFQPPIIPKIVPA